MRCALGPFSEATKDLPLLGRQCPQPTARLFHGFGLGGIAGVIVGVVLVGLRDRAAKDPLVQVLVAPREDGGRRMTLEEFTVRPQVGTQRVDVICGRCKGPVRDQRLNGLATAAGIVAAAEDHAKRLHRPQLHVAPEIAA